VLGHSCEVGLTTDDVMAASLSVCLSDMLQAACLRIKRASAGNNNNNNNNNNNYNSKYNSDSPRPSN
jgi:hypothetical protein